MPDSFPTLATLAHRLEAGRTTAVKLAETCLARIEDPAGEGGRAFTRVYRPQALAAALASDRLRAAGLRPGPLAGIPVSVKDLFDVAGEPTTAGSRLLRDAPPAAADAPIVARLRAAGAIIVGKTNMTEFAYSGLGLNPHYGTPANPHDPARIPGGSSSGAGVAGPYGFAAVSIGTDTGGSVRIPAAFNGVVGFKPTQNRVTRAGAVPLSTSQDTIGPLAASVACCALVDAVLAGEPPEPPPEPPVAGLRLAVPTRLLIEGLDTPVATAFAAALKRLADAGARVIEAAFPELDLLVEVARHGGVVAPEAHAWHRELLARGAALYDQRVRSRIEAGAALSAADYIAARQARRAAIAAFDRATAPFDAVLCPTVAIVPPRLDELADDEAYVRINALVLRNTSVFNVLDRPAVSLPCQPPGSLPVGLMAVGERGADRRLLGLAAALERALA